jgi:hypothetical protein
LDTFIERAFNYGLPTVLLVLVLVFLYRGIVWLGPNFLTPIKDQVILHLSKIDAAIDTMMHLVRGQTEALKRQNEVLSRVEHCIGESAETDETHTEMLKRIDDRVSDIHKAVASVRISQDKQ